MAEPADPLTLYREVTDDVARIRVVGELDLHTAPRLSEQLDEPPASGIKEVSLDLSGVDFLDSTGLRTLLIARERALAAGITFSVRGVAGPVEQVLQMTGLHDLLTGSGNRLG